MRMSKRVPMGQAARLTLLATLALAGLVILSSGGVDVQADVGDGGLAINARLLKPDEVAIGHEGEIYISDSEDFRVRRVDQNGVITTVAGTGVAGYSGDNGPGASAKIQSPFGIDVGPDGSLYIADSLNYRIRRVDRDGVITTVAGTGDPGYSGDNGSALQATMERAFAVAVDDDDGFYISDAFNGVIRYVDPGGTITTVAGTGFYGFSGDDGPAIDADLGDPYSIETGPDGSFYIGDSANFRVRRVDSKGIITTVAGDGTPGYGGDGALATEAQIGSMRDVSLGSDGSLYIADTFNHAVRRVGPDGIITTIAGIGDPGFSGDGEPGVGAELDRPYGVTPTDDGQVYIADADNDRVRRIGPTGNIQTVAGGEGEIPLPARDSSISGGVQDTGGDPLAGVCVEAYDASSYLAATSLTDGSGDYTIGNLAAGEYRIQFFDCEDGHASEWYDDKPSLASADAVDLPEDTDVKGIDATLLPGGSISGRVTASAEAIEGICVDAYDAAGSLIRTTATDDNGDYTLGGLVAGSYKLEFTDCRATAEYMAEWTGGGRDPESADSIVVTGTSETAGVDASLTKGGVISGEVRDDHGARLEDICVSAHDAPGSVVASVTTGSAGRYEIGGLPDGDYRVEFTDCLSPATHIPTWSGDAPSYESAAPVAVTKGAETEDIDAVLGTGGSISGVVITATGRPLQYVCVDAYTAPTAVSGSGFSDASGRYTIGGLVEGEHRVLFRDCSFPASYASEWYSDSPDFGSSDDIAVSEGRETTAVSAILGTATPAPSETPVSKLVQGDVDCDEDVDSVDALKQLRHVAALSVAQEPGCPGIGSEVASLFGDVDCDDDVDSVDALKVLRHVAALSVAQEEPCADIGG